MKIKRFLSAAVCIVLTAVCFAGCKGETFTRRQAQEKNTRHIQMMLDGNFEKVTEDFNSDLKAQLKAKDLQSAWQTYIPLGTAMPEAEVSVSEENGIFTVSTPFARQLVQVNISYNSKGEICGMWIGNLPVDTPAEQTAPENSSYSRSSLIQIGPANVNAVVTVPKNRENFPVAVLVAGSGASDFDETIGENKPFLDIADYLAANGIASIRMNKRFYQYPEMAQGNITIYDEYMEDALAAVDYAKANFGGDVYVIGHSQGAMSAPKIAADKNVRGIIMLAGTTRGLEDVVYDQNMAVIDTLPGSEKRRNIKALDDMYSRVKNLGEDSEAAPFGIPASYWLSLRDLDRENLLKNQLDIPVLILQGTGDFQVSYERDFLHMQSLLKDKDNIRFKSYENLNHLFMPVSKPGVSDISKYRRPSRVSPQVLADMADFIKNN